MPSFNAPGLFFGKILTLGVDLWTKRPYNIYILTKQMRANMQVKVYYTAFEDQPVHIATVEAPHATHLEACEYAFRWTQNIQDSWSKNMPADGNDSVTVVEPLHVDDEGNEWGHRSSSMGDHFLVDGTLYKCAAVGFEPAETIECRQHF